MRGKNKKEKLGGFFKSITKSADEVLISGQKVSLIQEIKIFRQSILLEKQELV